MPNVSMHDLTVHVQNELGNVAGEAILSTKNTAKLLGSRGPLGEFTALPDPEGPGGQEG